MPLATHPTAGHACCHCTIVSLCHVNQCKTEILAYLHFYRKPAVHDSKNLRPKRSHSEMQQAALDQLQDPLYQVPLFALATFLLYTLWGRLFPLVVCAVLLYLVLRQGNLLTEEVTTSQGHADLAEEKLRAKEKQLETIEEEHRCTLIRMKHQQNQVLEQMKQIELKIGNHGSP